MKKLFFILVVFQLLCSCRQSIFLQRKYVKGNYREKKENSEKPGQQPLENKNMNSPPAKLAVFADRERSNITKNRKEMVFASANKFSTSKNFFKVKILNDSVHTVCPDSIFLNDGQKWECKVETVSASELSLKNCDETRDPFQKINVKYVHHVKYANGIEERFDTENIVVKKAVNLTARPDPNRSAQKHFKGESFAVFGYILVFIAGLLSLFASPVIGALLMFLSVGAMFTIKGNFKVNKYLVKALIILGGIIGGLFLLSVAIGLIALIVLIATF